MNPRAGARLLLLFLGVVLGPASARAGAEHSILARAAPAEEIALGPLRAQGDFAPLLAELAAAAPDSAAAPGVTPAATEAPAAPVPPAAAGGEETQPSLVWPVLGGLVGGTVGLYGGAIASLAINDDGSSGLDDLGDAVFVGLVSEVVLLPLGVHLGNASKGSFLADLGFSALSSVAGIGLFALIQDTPGLIAGAGLHLGSVVYVERREARRRIEARRSAGEPGGP
jgi:hypothetical protein